MNNDELKAVFDKQASTYDKQWTRMAPINNGLYFLLESVFAELSSEKGSADYEAILEVWQRVMSGASVSPEGLSRIKAAYDKDVAVLPPTEVASIIECGGFEAPIQFFQAGFIHAWFAKRATGAIT